MATGLARQTGKEQRARIGERVPACGGWHVHEGAGNGLPVAGCVRGIFRSRVHVWNQYCVAVTLCTITVTIWLTSQHYHWPGNG